MAININTALPTEAISIPLLTPDGKKQVYPPTSDEVVYCEGNIKLRDKIDQMNVFETNLMVDALKYGLTTVGIDKLNDASSFDLTDTATSTNISSYYNVDDGEFKFTAGTADSPVDVQFITNLTTIDAGVDKLYADVEWVHDNSSSVSIYLLTESDSISNPSSWKIEAKKLNLELVNVVNLINETKFRLAFVFTCKGTEVIFKAFGWAIGKLENSVTPSTPSDTPAGSEVINLIANKQDIADNGLMTTNKTIVGAINEVFQDVDNGKRVIASAITDKGVSTSDNATFTTMANNIKSISTGTNTNDATAVASEILVGKSAYVKGAKITGTMPDISNNTSITHTADNGTKVIVGDAAYVSINSDGISRLQFRYNSGDGFLRANTLVGYPTSTLANNLGLTANKIKTNENIMGVTGTFTNDGTAGAAQILTGHVAYVKGNRIVGTMPSNNAVSATLTNQGQQISVPAGYTPGGVITTNISNLSAANIRSGVNVGGVVGSYSGGGYSGTLTLVHFQGSTGKWLLSQSFTNTISIYNDNGEILYLKTVPDGSSTGNGQNIYVSNGVIKSSAFGATDTLGNLTCSFSNTTRIYMQFSMRISTNAWTYPGSLSGLQLDTSLRGTSNTVIVDPLSVSGRPITVCFIITSNNPTITFASRNY